MAFLHYNDGDENKEINSQQYYEITLDRIVKIFVYKHCFILLLKC